MTPLTSFYCLCLLVGSFSDRVSCFADNTREFFDDLSRNANNNTETFAEIYNSNPESEAPYFVDNNPFVLEFLRLPVVISTWNYTNPTTKAFISLENSKSPVESVIHGITHCEYNVNDCGKTIGYGNSPDENGRVTLDAMVMDGTTMRSGAVGALHRIKNAIGVAGDVLKYTKHTMLVGEDATIFGKKMGYNLEPLETRESIESYKKWQLNRGCQPNFWKNLNSSRNVSCRQYMPVIKQNLKGTSNKNIQQNQENIRINNKRNLNSYEINNANEESLVSNDHDSFSMVAIDVDGNIAAGSSSNGNSYKIPGRVGDSAVVGASAFADSKVGAAVCSGKGDVIAIVSPSALAVEKLRDGANAYNAAKSALTRILDVDPNFYGGIVVVTNEGEYSAVCNGMRKFPFTVHNKILGKAVTLWIICEKTKREDSST